MAAPLAPADAVALMRAAGFEPLEPFVKSILPWKSRCTTCGETSSPSHANVRRGRGCGPCNKPVVTPEQAAAMLRAAGAEPLEPYPGKNNLPWRSRCMSCDREVSPRYANIQQGRGPCHPCGAQRAAERRRAARESAMAELLRELGAEPLEPFPGRHKPWRMQCSTCQHIGSPTLGNVLQRRSPCRPCGRARIGASQRLDPQEAATVMQRAGFVPQVAYPGYDEPWPCICPCGAAATPRLAGVVGGAKGCWSCAPRGFQHRFPSFVYLVEHGGLAAAKVGIANRRSRRLAEHARGGWEVRAVWHFPNGRPAQEIELAFLRHVRDTLGLPHGAKPDDMPAHGATETWPTSGLSATAAADLLADLVDQRDQDMSAA